ncbi:hypothetical protein B0H13DRAFT_1864729 [Mycena leptocephala]|nr:hypothetical protein B0H13DRAFT_1864729 [Mycena leptocephala]
MHHVLDAQEPAKKHNFDLAVFYGASRADIQSSAPPSVLKGPQQPPFTPANGSLRTLGFETGRFVVLGHSVLRSPPTSSDENRVARRHIPNADLLSRQETYPFGPSFIDGRSGQCGVNANIVEPTSIAPDLSAKRRHFRIHPRMSFTACLAPNLARAIYTLSPYSPSLHWERVCLILGPKLIQNAVKSGIQRMGVNATSKKLIEVESDWRSDKPGHGWLSTGRGPQFDTHATRSAQTRSSSKQSSWVPPAAILLTQNRFGRLKMMTDWLPLELK